MQQDNNKKMDALYSNTLRGIMEQVNSKGLQKEAIVQVLSAGSDFILLYYK
jgi:hypothetical protein